MRVLFHNLHAVATVFISLLARVKNKITYFYRRLHQVIMPKDCPTWKTGTAKYCQGDPNRVVNGNDSQAIDTKPGDIWAPGKVCMSYDKAASCPCNDEWEQLPGKAGTCKTDGWGACHDSSGGPGLQLQCRRKAYNGIASQCCSKPGLKIDSNGNTCDPAYNDPDSVECKGQVGNTCLIGGAKWAPGSECLKMYNNLDANGKTKAALAKDYLQHFLSLHIGKDGVQTDDRCSPPYWSVIAQICTENPSVCDLSLKNEVCKNVTRADIEGVYAKMGVKNISLMEKNMAALCGCHLPDKEYDKYKNAGIVDVGAYASCDPLCKMSGAIPRTADGHPQQCEASICIIDDVVINIINSDVNDINFSQVCPGKKQSTCMIGDMKIFDQGSHVGKIKLSQNCDKCFKKNPDPNLAAEPIRIDCETGKEIPPGGGDTPGGGGNDPSGGGDTPGGGGGTPNGLSKFMTWVKTYKFAIGGAVVALLILLFLWFMMGGSSQRVTPSADFAANAMLVGQMQ